MKNTILILTVLMLSSDIMAVNPSEAPSPNEILLKGWAYGCAGFVLIDYLNNKFPSYYGKDGASIHFGMDPKMNIEDNNAYDLLFSVEITKRKNIVYISYEHFNAILFYSYNIGYRRILTDKLITVSAGPELSIIGRGYGDYNSFGCNISISYNLNKSLAIEMRTNLKSRPDITKPYIFSNYVLLKLRI